MALERLWIATEPGFDVERLRRTRREVLANSRAASFAAIADGTFAGALTVYPHEEYGHVIGMFVDARFRGRGIGRRLLDAAIEWARARDLPSLSLLVFPHNTRAIEIYERAGFVQPEYYERDVVRAGGEVWDSILMTKVLRP